MMHTFAGSLIKDQILKHFHDLYLFINGTNNFKTVFPLPFCYKRSVDLSQTHDSTYYLPSKGTSEVEASPDAML